MRKKIAAFMLAAILLTGCVPAIIQSPQSTHNSSTSSATTATTTSTTTATVPSLTEPATTAPAPTTNPTTAPAPTIVPTTAPVLNGWQDADGNRYYYVSGKPITGWQEIDGTQYYFREDGRMARGKVVLSDTETRYFTSSGKEILLVNPWNALPADYTVKTITYTYNRSVAEICYQPLCQMIADCEAATNRVVVQSAYRTQDDQIYLYENKVSWLMRQGLSREQAEIKAGKVIAIPGTSEHQLGLAVDLADITYSNLDEAQENTPVQKWLMEHCWEYGFILRYPNGKTEKTGIIYEPWHYRYVGMELAMELRDSGLCLEEYLEQLTEE